MVLLTGVKEESTQHWRMLSLPRGGWDVEAGGLGESISFVTRELIHVRGNWAGDQRREQCSLGLDMDRCRVSKVKPGGLGTGCAKRVGENKVIGRHLH